MPDFEVKALTGKIVGRYCGICIHPSTYHENGACSVSMCDCTRTKAEIVENLQHEDRGNHYVTIKEWEALTKHRKQTKRRMTAGSRRKA